MEKKTVLESLKDFLQNVQNIFSIFFFVFYWKRKKRTLPPFAPHFPSILGGSSAASPLKNLGCDAPISEDTFWAKNRNLTILTIFAQTTPLNLMFSHYMFYPMLFEQGCYLLFWIYFSEAWRMNEQWNEIKII